MHEYIMQREGGSKRMGVLKGGGRSGLVGWQGSAYNSSITVFRERLLHAFFFAQESKLEKKKKVKQKKRQPVFLPF